MHRKCEICIYKFEHKHHDWGISGHVAVAFTVVAAHTIDLFWSTTNWTDVRTKDATRNEKESARVVSAFARDLVLSPCSSALEARTTFSVLLLEVCTNHAILWYCQLSRRDVSRPASYERLIRVRACMREQMF